MTLKPYNQIQAVMECLRKSTFDKTSHLKFSSICLRKLWWLAKRRILFEVKITTETCVPFNGSRMLQKMICHIVKNWIRKKNFSSSLNMAKKVFHIKKEMLTDLLLLFHTFFFLFKIGDSSTQELQSQNFFCFSFRYGRQMER
jgi:hypothetical protein